MEKTTNSLIKIAILGAESTGKTWLCNQLALHYKTCYVPEYARTYFETHSINQYTIETLELIAKKQLELENSFSKNANNVLFSDTSLITIKIWANQKFNHCPNFILNNITNHYDLCLITNNDIEWVADDQRKDENLRDFIFNMNVAELEKINQKYKIVTGKNQERLHHAISIINSQFNIKK